MTARLYRYAGIGAFGGAGGVLWNAPHPVPSGAALLTAIFAIAGIVLLSHSGDLK